MTTRVVCLAPHLTAKVVSLEKLVESGTAEEDLNEMLREKIELCEMGYGGRQEFGFPAWGA